MTTRRDRGLAKLREIAERAGEPNTGKLAVGSLEVDRSCGDAMIERLTLDHPDDALFFRWPMGDPMYGMVVMISALDNSGDEVEYVLVDIDGGDLIVRRMGARPSMWW